VPGLVIFAAVSVLVVAHVAAYRPLSPFDEGVHFDYVIEASRGEIVRKGEKLGQEAMREIACRGVDLEGIALPPCKDVRFDPNAFPGHGFSSAEVHPPVYYGVTGLLARGLVATGIAPDMFTAARLVGILWLGLGLLLIWYIGKELGVPTAPLAVVLAALAATPTLLHASAIVNNDATGLVAGGLLAWVTLHWERGSTPLWLVGAVAVLALALKTTNALAVGLCAVYLALHPRPSEAPVQTRRSNRAGIAALLGGAVVALVAWVVVRGLLATPVELPPDAAAPPGLELMAVVGNLTTLITPVSYGVPAEVMGAIGFWSIGQYLGFLMVAATVAPVLRGSISERSERLAASAGMTLLLGGALSALASFALYGRVSVSPRYGLSLIPVLGIALAAAIRSRAALWGLGAFAAGQLAFVLWELVRA
jgi:hypothetical protein